MSSDDRRAATALAHPNIALVKYWGKRDKGLNLPAADSLSITLDALTTRTGVCFDPALPEDTFLLNDKRDNQSLSRISACLDILRQKADVTCRAAITTHNDFPTAAGLASSASGFAALVTAANSALGLPEDKPFLSRVARQGSGSAARSLFGGFAIMHAGQEDNGSDACAEPLLDAQAWPLKVVVAITSQHPKAVASGEGMEISRSTSPFHQDWVASVADDITLAKKAVAGRDFASLATVSEQSCLKMHAVMLSSWPPLMYWQPATLACMQRIRELRAAGVNVFFTVDAGPQVKAVCEPQFVDEVKAALADVAGVETLLVSSLGAGATLVDAAGAV